MSIKKGMLITSLAFICLFSLIIVAAIPDIEECTTSPHHAQDLYPGKVVESCETEKHPAESFFAFVSFLSGTVFAISIYFYSSKSLATSAQRSMQENVKNEKRKKEMKIYEANNFEKYEDYDKAISIWNELENHNEIERLTKIKALHMEKLNEHDLASTPHAPSNYATS